MSTGHPGTEVPVYELSVTQVTFYAITIYNLVLIFVTPQKTLGVVFKYFSANRIVRGGAVIGFAAERPAGGKY